ncbi:MAG TPA: hypothetical protein VNK07_00210 [Candidatus Binatia bacterium]|nr:hypothetical protein [Candidatus Binatia bacterium]
MMNQPQDKMAYEISSMSVGQKLETDLYQLKLDGVKQSNDGMLYYVVLLDRKTQKIVFKAPLLPSSPKRLRY